MKISFSKIIILLVVSYLIFQVIKWNVSKNQIQNLCKKTEIDDSIIEIKESLKHSWLLRFSDTDFKGNNMLLVHSYASLGRYTCSIEYKGKNVTNTEYSYLEKILGKLNFWLYIKYILVQLILKTLPL